MISNERFSRTGPGCQQPAQSMKFYCAGSASVAADFDAFITETKKHPFLKYSYFVIKRSLPDVKNPPVF
jgi:hypothetical protein